MCAVARETSLPNWDQNGGAGPVSTSLSLSVSVSLFVCFSLSKFIFPLGYIQNINYDSLREEAARYEVMGNRESVKSSQTSALGFVHLLETSPV